MFVLFPNQINYPYYNLSDRTWIEPKFPYFYCPGGKKLEILTNRAAAVPHGAGVILYENTQNWGGVLAILRKFWEFAILWLTDGKVYGIFGSNRIERSKRYS